MFNYNHPYWKKKRSRIIKRDDGKCRYCKSEDNLHAHHTSYFQNREIWDYPDDMLITLCESCHQSIHVELDWIKDILDHIQFSDIRSVYKLRRLITEYLKGGIKLSDESELDPSQYHGRSFSDIVDECIKETRERVANFRRPKEKPF